MSVSALDRKRFVVEHMEGGGGVNYLSERRYCCRRRLSGAATSTKRSTPFWRREETVLLKSSPLAAAASAPASAAPMVFIPLWAITAAATASAIRFPQVPAFLSLRPAPLTCRHKIAFPTEFVSEKSGPGVEHGAFCPSAGGPINHYSAFLFCYRDH